MSGTNPDTVKGTGGRILGVSAGLFGNREVSHLIFPDAEGGYYAIRTLGRIYVLHALSCHVEDHALPLRCLFLKLLRYEYLHREGGHHNFP